LSDFLIQCNTSEMESPRARNSNLVGIVGVVVMGAVLVYCFLPYSVRPTPPVFLLIVWTGALASAVLAIVAGCRSSRAWLLFVPFPIAFFLMTLNFEQST